MPKQSAGLLVYRTKSSALEVFLVHPGGPYWANKDDASWSIPKGEFDLDEDPLAAAQREFREETGLNISGPYVSLGTIRSSSGKTLHAYAVRADVDPKAIVSNTFTLEWPPRSGKMVGFPEVDRAAWFPTAVAEAKIHRGQRELLQRLRIHLMPA